MTALLGFLLLTATEAAWTNFVIFDQHYLLMAKCWFTWYERNASPNHLKVACMDRDACDEAETWRLPKEQTELYTLDPEAFKASEAGELVPVDVLEAMEKYDLESMGPTSQVQTGAAGSHLQSPRKTSASLLQRGQMEWPKPEYINLFHRVLWDTLEERQQDVLHVDVDALWIKTPDQRLEAVLAEHPDADIIASSSVELNPEDLAYKWGFVLNVGFILYRNTEPMRRLFTEELLTAEEPSCQQLLNYALDRKGCRWTGSDTSSSDQVGICGDLKVVALSQGFVSRAVEWAYDVGEEVESEQPSVAHPDTGNLSWDFRGAGRLNVFTDMNLC